jgi:dTDP-4-amino-4,6-dideoxygalactose transaminase
VLEATADKYNSNLQRLFSRMQFILGEEVRGFERELAVSFGAKFAVGVGSGTAAIELCLRASGIIRAEQQVLTPALTSPFTAQAILASGAAPRFCDVDPETLLLDPGDAANRMTRNTAALLPVHLYGQVCDLPRLTSLARHADVILIQDACQAHGARSFARPFTYYSNWVAYSFYPTKNLGCLGDGGAILTRSAAVSNRLRMLRDGGRSSDQVSRIPAINSRLDEMQACYLRAFLPRLPEWNRDRARLAALYDQALSGCCDIKTLSRSPESVNHVYVIRAPRREALRSYLRRRGIATSVHYPVPLHLQPAFANRELKRGALPQAESASREVVSLPLWPYMPESMVLEVSDRVRGFYR